MVFARIHGAVIWTCPTCNQICRSRLTPVRYWLDCRSCHATFIAGLVLYKKPPGPKQLYQDTVMLLDFFPHKRGINQVYCDHCSAEISQGAEAANRQREFPKANSSWFRDAEPRTPQIPTRKRSRRL